MNYGLYIAAGGALNSMHRLDVAANNLANVETTAFKRDLAVTMQRDAARIEDGLSNLPSNELLERLGAGVLGAPVRTDLSAAAPRVTNNPLDVAIRGEGFFVVRDGRADDADSLRFTRDGRFLRSGDGTLVTAAGGMPVLDDRDQPIRLDPAAPVNISPAGAVEQGGEIIARLQVVGVADEASIEKQGAGLFRPRVRGADPRVPVAVDLLPGAVESSGVDPIHEMMVVSHASSDAQRNTRMISVYDELMDRAINTLGRIG